MKKCVFFAFRDHPLCFIHVLLNSLDMAAKGMEGKIVLEGEAVKLVAVMTQTDHFLYPLYSKVQAEGLFVGACRACSSKLGATDAVVQAGIPLIGKMSGHPAMSEFIDQGYTVLTF